MRKPSIHVKAALFGDAVFAANDGIITTFAIIAGSTGASFSSKVVLILGFANLFADGISMAAGNYLGVKSEIEYERSKQGGRSDNHSPLKHGATTFVFFAIAGLLPILPYIFFRENEFVLSAGVVVLSLFVMGSLRSLYTKKNWFAGGLEVLIIGGLAALAAYGVGFAFDKYVI